MIKLIQIMLRPLAFISVVLFYLFFIVFKYQSIYIHKIFRKTFVLTGGKINDFLTRFIILTSRMFTNNELAGLTQSATNLMTEVNDFQESMNKNGFYIFNASMEKDQLSILLKSLNSMEMYYSEPLSKSQIRVDRLNNYSHLSNKFHRLKKDLIGNENVRSWALSRDIVNLAQIYLGSKAYCDLIASWQSYPTDDVILQKRSAQHFHFDMDRIKFIKFFVYLTDVDCNNGPHAYIRGSHKLLPRELRFDGRFEDARIFGSYNKEDYIEVKGKAGTIIAVDTRGLHKGVPLRQGFRDILQVEFSNSPFGLSFRKEKGELPDLTLSEREVLKYF